MSNKIEELNSFVKVPVKRGFKEIRNLYGFLGLYRAYICGGYTRYMASPNDNTPLPGDIDIFCEDVEVFYSLTEQFYEAGLEKKMHTSFAIKYRIPEDKNHLLYTPYPIHLVFPMDKKEAGFVMSGSIERILTFFDLTIVRCGLLNQYYILADPAFISDEEQKNLKLRRTNYPPGNLKRMFKYVKRGYNVPNSYELNKIFKTQQKEENKQEDSEFDIWRYFAGEEMEENGSK